MSTRFIIELASAFPPNGESVLTQERYDRMLALASEIINKGMLVDSLRPGITNVQLSILASGRLGTTRENDRYVEAVQMFSRLRAQSVLDDARELRAEEPHAAFDIKRADELAEQTFGFSYSELFQAAEILDSLLEDGQTLVSTRDELESALCNGASFSIEKARAVLDAITLTPFSGTFVQFWEDLPSVAPWRFNRDRSYLKRPLIQNGPEVVFARRVLAHAPVYWIEQFRSGRLRVKGKMASAMSEQRHAKGRAFERDVAALLSDLDYGPIKERLRRVGNHDFRKLNGRNLGDIDVAAVHRGRKELLLVEAKDLEVARTPTELRNEIEQLIGPGNSAIARLKERGDWVQAHLASVLKAFGIEDPTGWAPRLVVVVKQLLLSEHMHLNHNIPVVAMSRLTDHLRERRSAVGGKRTR